MMIFHSSISDMLNSKTKLKIIKFLLTHEASMSEREIASTLNISHMSINRTMRELSASNFVNFVTIGKAHLWKANRKSYAFKAFSEFFKNISLIEDPLNDLKNSLLKDIPKDLIKKMVLFGSVAEGEEKTDSDIDIFFLVEDEKDKEKLKFYIEKLSNIYLESYGNRLSPYFLTEREMIEKKSLKLISEINKGLEIYPNIKNKSRLRKPKPATLKNNHKKIELDFSCD